METDRIGNKKTDETMEALIRTTAHLAAQLTMTQIRLRALATVVAQSGAVDAEVVANEVRTLANESTGEYLQENLGDFLCDVIEVKPLEAQLQEFLREIGDR